VPDLTWDVEHYAHDNPEFPRRSTGDQFYDEWDFEAYRELGHTLADRMLAEFLPQAGRVTNGAVDPTHLVRRINRTV